MTNMTNMTNIPNMTNMIKSAKYSVWETNIFILQIFSFSKYFLRFPSPPQKYIFLLKIFCSFSFFVFPLLLRNYMYLPFPNIILLFLLRFSFLPRKYTYFPFPNIFLPFLLCFSSPLQKIFSHFPFLFSSTKTYFSFSLFTWSCFSSTKLWIKGPQIGSDMPSAFGLVYILFLLCVIMKI